MKFTVRQKGSEPQTFEIPQIDGTLADIVKRLGERSTLHLVQEGAIKEGRAIIAKALLTGKDPQAELIAAKLGGTPPGRRTDPILRAREQARKVMANMTPDELKAYREVLTG